MNSHLIHIPSLRTLTTRCLSRSNLQRSKISLPETTPRAPSSRKTDWARKTYLENLGRQSHRPLDTELLALSTLEQLRAHLLERRHLARGQGDSDLVDLGAFAEIFLGFLEGHDCCSIGCLVCFGVLE